MRKTCKYAVGDTSNRPWGRWTVLAVGNAFIVKEIVVNPGHVLSLQSHQHRAEHWIVLSGLAEVTLGETEFTRAANESVFIPPTSLHRVRSLGPDDLVFIEIQTGELLSEDDIQRFEDNYGRAPNAVE